MALNGTWMEEKEEREKRALEEHNRLHTLFKENRFAFELERKRMIKEVIDSVKDEETRNNLIAFQADWDKKMKGAGSAHNRFVLAQTFFWEHVHEKWLPKLKEFESILNSKYPKETIN